MASLLVLARGNTTGISLGANAFWRISLGATIDGSGGSYFSLVLIYPPSAGMSFDQARIVLTRTHVPMANNQLEVERVASVSLQGGTLEADISRMTEAFNLFRNNPRTKSEAVDTAIKDAGDVVGAYWAIRMWMLNGAKEEKTISVNSYDIVCQP